MCHTVRFPLQKTPHLLQASLPQKEHGPQWLVGGCSWQTCYGEFVLEPNPEVVIPPKKASIRLGNTRGSNNWRTNEGARLATSSSSRLVDSWPKTQGSRWGQILSFLIDDSLSQIGGFSMLYFLPSDKEDLYSLPSCLDSFLQIQ